jgi:hypothetical protein
MLGAVGRSLLVDPQLDLISLARQFESLTSGKIDFATIPNNGVQLIYPDGVPTSIVQVNRSAIPAFITSLEGKSDSAYANAAPAAPASVTMDVLNGTDIPRLAARNATRLRALGVTVDTVDSAAATRTTVVEYPAGRESQAKAIARLAPGARAALTPDATRVTLVLGADGHWATGVARPAAAHNAAKKADPTHGLGCID